jgi:hypothetical protein
MAHAGSAVSDRDPGGDGIAARLREFIRYTPDGTGIGDD